MTKARDVLIIEDEAMIGMHLQMLVEDLGSTARIVTTEADALAAIERELPDLVFLDFHLQNRNSKAIAGLLRARGVPVVVCSGSLDGDFPRVLDGLPVINKPFRDDEVEEAFRSALGNKTG